MPNKLFLLLQLFLIPFHPGMTSAQAVFHVNQNGALPDTQQDSGPAIRATIQKAIESGKPAEVRLGKGVYHVDGTTDEFAIFSLHQARHLTIRGEGDSTELIITNPRLGAFFLSDCNDVHITGFSVDYDPLPFTQGLIESVSPEAGWFDLAIAEGYDGLDQPWYSSVEKPFGCWGMVYEQTGRVLKKGASDHFMIDHWQKMTPGIWRLFVPDGAKASLSELEPGDPYVQMARTGFGAVFFHNSADCSASNLKIHASPGLAFGSQISDGIVFRGNRVIHKPNQDRLLTTNADGIHCQQNRRGPVIEDCLLEGMADDGVNLYYYPNTILDVLSPTQLIASEGGQLETGDLIQVYNSRIGVSKGQSRIVSSQFQNDRTWKIELATPLEGILAGQSHTTADTIYNLSRCNRGFIIRNNLFRNHRRHGMMIKAPGGLIENNRVEGVGGYGIVIGNDADWPEGVAPNDVVVKNNQISNVGNTSLWYRHDRKSAAIVVYTSALSQPIAADRLVQQILLQDNRIINPPAAGYYLGSVQDVRITGGEVVLEESFVPSRKTSLIVVENAEGVMIDRVRTDGSHPQVESVLSISDSVDDGAAGIRWNDLQVSPNSPWKVIDDQRKPSHP